MTDFTQPLPGEYPPYAHAYVTATAAALTSDNDISALLARQPEELEALLASAPPDIARHAYAPGKWTLVESIVHMTDTERVFAYRLLRIARGDTTPLPGFDQDAWVPESRAKHRPLQSVLEEFRAVRNATLSLASSLDATALGRQGTASEHPVSARALIAMIAGHAAHHITIIAERYLTPAGRH